jgi:hypothetical protein
MEMLVWLLIIAGLYLPWVSMYRFMRLADYARPWRAFVPGWNLLVAFDLAKSDRLASLWLFSTLPVALIIYVIAGASDVVGNNDAGPTQEAQASISTELTIALIALSLLPSLVMFSILGGRLAVATARSRLSGLIAGLFWVVGLPVLAFTAKTNAGLEPEYRPLPPLRLSRG